MTSRSHQGMFSPPEKKEPTASKNLPILASMAIADLRYGQLVRSFHSWGPDRASDENGRERSGKHLNHSCSCFILPGTGTGMG